MTLRMRLAMMFFFLFLCAVGTSIDADKTDRLYKAENATRQAQAVQAQMQDTIEQMEIELRKKDAELAKKDEEIARKTQALGEAQRKPQNAPTLASRGGAPFTPPMLEGFQVTWYNDSGVTKSGRQTEDGVTVAVDPAVIPLGTWIELVFPDGTLLKRRADDTGGAVHGRIIDVYANATTGELLNRGRAYGVKVRIL